MGSRLVLRGGGDCCLSLLSRVWHDGFDDLGFELGYVGLSSGLSWGQGDLDFVLLGDARDA